MLSCREKNRHALYTSQKNPLLPPGVCSPKCIGIITLYLKKWHRRVGLVFKGGTVHMRS
jgi:hypothetical protein